MNETLLSPNQFAANDEISRVEVYRRMRRGDPDFLPSRDRREIDGKPGRLISSAFLSYDGKQRLLTAELAAAVKPEASKADSTADASPRLTLFPELDADRKALASIESKNRKEIA